VSDKIDWREVRKKLQRAITHPNMFDLEPSNHVTYQEAADAIKAAFCAALDEAASACSTRGQRELAYMLEEKRQRIESGQEEP
jgi:hypothetical protein